jgi:hypothetical protein
VASVGPAKPDIRELRARFEAHGQGHVFRFWDRLDRDAQRRLEAQAETLDLPALVRGFRATQERRGVASLEPPMSAACAGSSFASASAVVRSYASATAR